MPQRNVTSKNPPTQKHQIDVSCGKLGMDASPYTKNLCRKVRKVSYLNIVDLFFLDEIKKYCKINMAKKTLFHESWLEEQKQLPRCFL